MTLPAIIPRPGELPGTEMNISNALGAGPRFESGHPDQFRAHVDLRKDHLGSRGRSQRAALPSVAYMKMCSTSSCTPEALMRPFTWTRMETAADASGARASAACPLAQRRRGLIGISGAGR